MLPLAPAITRLLARPLEARRIGAFQLVEQLGSGGFAPVWLARETYGRTELRTAAVKLFSLDGAPHGGKSRIVEEARALCRVEHPNVVRFYALSVDEELGVMALAMEHVAGTPLDQRLAREKRLSPSETIRVGVAIASALAAVHQKGLVHRDVKPSNIVEASGTYKLIDFGIASLSASAAEEAAREAPVSIPEDAALASTARISGLISGTLGYIDPACFTGIAPPSASSDLYALGATLYECLTGLLPATAPSGGSRIDPRVISGVMSPPPLATHAPKVPAALATLIDRMLAPERGERPPSASWVVHRLEAIRREIAGKERALPPEDEGPFRGLLRFEARDRDVFFGRSREIAAALELLRGRGLVALVGPSGSGKSSLGRAGLLPAVAEGALAAWPEAWDTVVVEPGRDPHAVLLAALAPFLKDAIDVERADPDVIVEALVRRAQDEGRGFVLFVDQLEELCTAASPESRDAAAELLAQFAAQASPGVRAVVAARRDLLDPLLSLGDLGRALSRGICLVDPISPLDWREIVEQALGAYGYAPEDAALADELFAGIDATAGAMPLVMFALTELWRTRDAAKKKLTRAGLAEVGGVEGALERHAEATLAAIVRDHPGAEATAREALLALTTPEGTRAARSEEELAQLCAGPTREVVEAFERARLLVPAEGGVTLAHEALISRWGRLGRWVEEARADRVLAGEIERDAARWRADRESVPLWRARRLGFAGDLVRRGTVRLSEGARAFVRASQRAERRGRLLVVGAAVAVLLSLGGAGLAYVRAVRAEEAKARTEEAAAKDRLAQEQKTRKEAEDAQAKLQATNGKLEEANRELSKANHEIDKLMDDVLSSKQSRAAVEEKLEEIRSRAKRAVGRPPVAPIARVSTDKPADPAPVPPAPPVPAEGKAKEIADLPKKKPGVALETDWQ